MGIGSCGYGLATSSKVQAIHVGRVNDPGIDVDASAWANGAVRRALQRAPVFRLVSLSQADATLEVDLISANSLLAPMSDPNLRAMFYRVVVVLRARLLDPQEKLLWKSSDIVGEAPYFSQPGPIETLEGARREALQRASTEAAERLVTSLQIALSAPAFR